MYQEVLDGITSFEIHINPMFSANIFAALPHALNVWDNYVWLVVVASFVGCPLRKPLQMARQKLVSNTS